VGIKREIGRTVFMLLLKFTVFSIKFAGRGLKYKSISVMCGLRLWRVSKQAAAGWAGSVVPRFNPLCHCSQMGEDSWEGVLAYWNPVICKGFAVKHVVSRWLCIY
jgi:hypothetical protein